LYWVILEERLSVRVLASAVEESSKCGQNNSDFSEDIVNSLKMVEDRNM